MKLLIVDDEPHARSDLIELCEGSDDVDVVGEAESGMAAIDADYLVKSVSADRFAQSMARARQRCDPTDAGTEPAQTPHEPQTAHESSATGGAEFRLLVGEREHRLYPMNPETIDYIESDGNYVTIRSGSAKFISRDTIKRLSADLADVGFIRIERSLLVNIRAVAYVEAVGRGMFAFTLTSGAVLHSSTGYRDSILRILPMRRLSMRRT